MNPQKRAFYEYHASLMEPWDGPAAIAFTDGRSIGATLDRNGLRPARYLVTQDDLVHHGVGIRRARRCRPSRWCAKAACSPAKCCWWIPWRAASSPTGRSSARSTAAIRTSSGSRKTRSRSSNSAIRRASTAPTTRPWCCASAPSATPPKISKMILGPMADKGEEPIGSMGADTPLACLSDQPQPLFHYFKQLFAQVTNPPIDPIREEMVMSLTSYIGNERNILAETPHALPHPEAAASHPHQSRPGEAAPRVARRFSGHHAAHALPGRGRRQGPGAGPQSALPPRLAGHPVGLYAADPVRPRHGPGLRARFPACWRWPRCTITWCARRPARRWR